MNTDNLLKILKHKKMTQKVLAEKAGIGQATVSELINKKRHKPSITTVEKIAKAIDVSIEDLL